MVEIISLLTDNTINRMQIIKGNNLITLLFANARRINGIKIIDDACIVYAKTNNNKHLKYCLSMMAIELRKQRVMDNPCLIMDISKR